MSKTKIYALLHGLYPHSEQLARISRDVTRYRKTEDDLFAAQKKDTQHLLAIQKKLGFAFAEDGMFLWQDIFRPIVASTDGMTVGPLTRFFDNNNFFRQPIITKPVRFNEEKMIKFFTPLEKNWKVTIPSPFLFAKLAASDRFSSEEKLEQTTGLIKQVILCLEKLGVLFIQLAEPAIPYYGFSKKEEQLFIKSLQSVIPKEKKAIIAVHFYFGDAASIVKALSKARIGIDAVGIDFVKTNLTSLPKHLPYAIIAGVVEGRNSLIEKDKDIIVFVKKLIKTFKPDVLYITHNSSLELLPETVAVKKVALLGSIQKKFS